MPRTAAARTTSDSHRKCFQVNHRCGHQCCHHCRHLRNHCCQLRKVVVHAPHQLLSIVSLSCYCCIRFVQSIHHGAYSRLQGGKLIFHLDVRVRKADTDHIVMLPVIVRKSHSVCSYCLVSPLFHITCVFLDQFQFLCTLQNFKNITT